MTSSTPDILLLTPPTPSTLIQLSDLGLAQFIDPNTPLTRTRCGSEAYAAPEVVTSGRAYDDHDPPRDGRLGLRYRPLCRLCPSAAVWGCTHRRKERRRWLVGIARGEYVLARDRVRPAGAGGIRRDVGLVRCQGARRMVGRLLVRDPVRRATVRELWTDEWMCGNPIQGRLVDPS